MIVCDKSVPFVSEGSLTPRRSTLGCGRCWKKAAIRFVERVWAIQTEPFCSSIRLEPDHEISSDLLVSLGLVGYGSFEPICLSDDS